MGGDGVVEALQGNFKGCLDELLQLVLKDQGTSNSSNPDQVCGTVQVCVCVSIGCFMDGWPSGRRGVLDMLSGGGTAAAAAATIYREDSSSLPRSMCFFARMTCITRLFYLYSRECACLSLGPLHSFV